MVTFRCTSKLLERLKLKPDAAPPRSTGRLGDIYCNLLYIRREQLILCASEATLLPVVLPAGDARSFPGRFVEGLREVLRHLAVPDELIEAELGAFDQPAFAKTANRRVLGVMTDFAFMLEAAARPDEPLLSRSLWLARSPCSPIGMDSSDRATLKAFGMR